MLDLFARHGLFDLEVKVDGDLHIDQHHSAEDCGIALGQAFAKALGDKRGVTRYADIHLPMDEALTRVCVDISGRPFLVFRTSFRSRDRPVRHRAGARVVPVLRDECRLTLQHARPCTATNAHTNRRELLQGAGPALRKAVAIDPREEGRVPSTKVSCRPRFVALPNGRSGRRRTLSPDFRDADAQLHAPPAGRCAAAESIGLERALLVRDGFSWPAFAFSVLWFLYHRLWIAALVVLAGLMALAGLGHALGTAPRYRHPRDPAGLLADRRRGVEPAPLETLARRGWPARERCHGRHPPRGSRGQALGRWLDATAPAPRPAVPRPDRPVAASR